jgi:glutamyl-tRNA synthetase
MTLSNEIYAYALENALTHEGKAMPSAVLPKLFQHGLKKEEIGKIMPEINEAIKRVNLLSKENLNSEFEKNKQYLKEKVEQEKGLKDLPNHSKKMVFRLAPFPSGGLHIGNTKTYLLNALYAEKYKAKTLLIIDDTIGSEEKQIVPEAYKLIPDAFKWLKVKYKTPIMYKSDRLKIYYKYAEQIIKKDKAYVCSCSQEQIHDNRVKQLECGCRQYPVEEQMKRWKKMFKAKPGAFVLRLKTSMQDPNPAFRDRVLFRISDRNHARVKKKYRVWPLLEFSWAVDDHLLGVTHVIRGKELMMEGQMQKYIWDIFGWKDDCTFIYAGLVKLTGLEGKLSKSKAQKEVLSGQYSGWDDPRTWSVQSLRRRGILPETIREFVESIGLNQNDIEVPIDAIYSINRKKLDNSSKRYFFVAEPVQIKVAGAPQISEVEAKLHPEKKTIRKIKVDSSKIFVSMNDFAKFKDKEVRLMHLYNILLAESKNAKFTSQENKQEIPKIHWISSDNVKVKVMMPEGHYTLGLAESNIKSIKPGEIIQFERFGFCRFDNFNKKENTYEFWFAHD